LNSAARMNYVWQIHGFEKMKEIRSYSDQEAIKLKLITFL